jgi:beta-alanine degradation protein BauB
MATLSREDELGNIATTLLFENDRVRVWEMVLDPGEACILHRHVHDYLWVDVTPSRKELLGPYDPRVVFHDDGFVQYNVVGKGGRTYDTGIRNVGEGRQRQIVVELLGESVADAELEPENNGRAS